MEERRLKSKLVKKSKKPKVAETIVKSEAAEDSLSPSQNLQALNEKALLSRPLVPFALTSERIKKPPV
ncbi:hypothetical protein NXF25_009656 [Crotalus adamanteus]|uniref:Uncharacterized protein n=1 Tax=Crotalus adamanteus TaxID=8729 RepID=A0AAW1BRS5_CROAD